MWMKMSYEKEKFEWSLKEDETSHGFSEVQKIKCLQSESV